MLYKAALTFTSVGCCELKLHLLLYLEFKSDDVRWLMVQYRRPATVFAKQGFF